RSGAWTPRWDGWRESSRPRSAEASSIGLIGMPTVQFDIIGHFLYLGDQLYSLLSEDQGTVRTEVRAMISVRTQIIVPGVLLTGLLTTTIACALQAETPRASEVKQPSTIVLPATPDLVPVSAPAASEMREAPRPPEIPATVDRRSNDAYDPRAVMYGGLEPLARRGERLQLAFIH